MTGWAPQTTRPSPYEPWPSGSPTTLDTSRVGIRGWSFGGYLAALAVLRPPDVFGAAIAGAPTSDERLYDTCYSERYLGDPNVNADVYDRNSLVPLAPHPISDDHPRS